tara:strand:+ start:1873 stop:2085 length:213 start_codon:yes stop_codon:yes gene_type:complete
MDNLKKIPINYTYPQKKVINNGKINMLDNYYVFDASDKKTILKDGDNLTISKAIDEFNKNFNKKNTNYEI